MCKTFQILFLFVDIFNKDKIQIFSKDKIILCFCPVFMFILFAICKYILIGKLCALLNFSVQEIRSSLSENIKHAVFTYLNTYLNEMLIINRRKLLEYEDTLSTPCVPKPPFSQLCDLL